MMSHAFVQVHGLFILYIGAIIAVRMQNSTLRLWLLTIVAQVFVACQPETPITYPPGGYDYPAKDSVTDTNFYFYPLKAHFPHKELFGVSRYYLFYQAFNEPNLSIKPKENDIFRFQYFGFKTMSMFITFTKNEMIIKKGTKYNMTQELIDTNRLTITERSQYHLLERYFPLTENNYNKKSRIGRLIDSMLRLYPQLLNTDYCKYLFAKIIIPNANHKNYTVRKIALATGEFRHLVDIINASGYWKMPYEITCGVEVLDGNGFSLEANTGKKYNYVQFGSCAENTDMQKAFVVACRAIVERANLGEKIYF